MCVCIHSNCQFLQILLDKKTSYILDLLHGEIFCLQIEILRILTSIIHQATNLSSWPNKLNTSQVFKFTLLKECIQ